MVTRRGRPYYPLAWFVDREVVVEHQPGFFKRLALAFALFFKLLADAALAARVQKVMAGGDAEPERLPAPAREPSTKPEAAAKPKPKPAAKAGTGRVVQLLAALQREGRFVDFVEEDLGAGVSDADIGAAARMVHAGCKKVLDGWFKLEAVWPGEEGSTVTIEEGFDKRRVQLTGNVDGEPPFKGVLAHHGWRVAESRLPTISGAVDPSIVTPAEVDLS